MTGSICRMKVMVVDDHHDTLVSTSALLRVWGYGVIEASEGKEAIDKHTSERPDFILLDLAMPGMTGLDVARMIRKDPGPKRPTLVAHTGLGGLLHEQLTREAGFDFMLLKPVDPESLRTVLAWFS